MPPLPPTRLPTIDATPEPSMVTAAILEALERSRAAAPASPPSGDEPPRPGVGPAVAGPAAPSGRLLDAVAGRFDGVRCSGAGYAALYPAHDDTRPSLSLAAGDDGRVLVHCHAGCADRDVLPAAGLDFAVLFPSPREFEAAYDYRAADGTLRFQVVRYRDPKAFRQRRPNGAGGFAWTTRDVPKVLYRLPELLAADPGDLVFLCEGEKDADRLAALGLVATTNAGGAGKWEAGYTDALIHKPGDAVRFFVGRLSTVRTRSRTVW